MGASAAIRIDGFRPVLAELSALMIVITEDTLKSGSCDGGGGRGLSY